MLYTFPHYYGTFRCVASECTDTCCAGWAILIDEDSLKGYSKEKGPFGNRLHNSIDWKEGDFKRYQGRCAFLNEDNLCDIYREIGKEKLCKTCKTYPRHIEEFEGVREYSLCLSCIEAAKMILGTKEPVRFLSREDDREETEDYGEDFDFFLYTKLMDARSMMIEMLQERGTHIALRVSMCLALAHDLQGRIRRSCLYEADHLFKRYEREGRWNAFSRKIAECGLEAHSRFPVMEDLFDILEGMEPLKEDWPGYRKELREVLYGKGQKAYEDRRQVFLKGDGEDQKPVWQPVWTEQLMVYFIFTYFCGAVYQGTPYGKVKMAVAAALIIEDMAQAIWQQKGSLSFMDTVEAAHRFSREVEHSDENKVLLEEHLVKDSAFSLIRLLGAVNH